MGVRDFILPIKDRDRKNMTPKETVQRLNDVCRSCFTGKEFRVTQKHKKPLSRR